MQRPAPGSPPIPPGLAVSGDHPGQPREAVGASYPEVSIVIPVHNESGGL